MIEFFKNESGIKLEVEELAHLIELDVLEYMVDVILALDEGLIEESVQTSDILRMIIENQGESD